MLLDFLNAPSRTRRAFYMLQGTDIPVQKHLPFILAHAHLKGVWFRPACVDLHRMHY